MRHALIVHATVEGQTRRIAEALASDLEEAGARAELADAAAPSPQASLAGADVVVIAAPVHQARYPSAIEHFIREHRDELATKTSALVSVSLCAATGLEEDHEEALGYVDALTDRTGWRPDHVHHAAGALRYSRYDFFKRWIMRRIAKSKGMPTDTSHDVEYTDWDALCRFARELAS